MEPLNASAIGIRTKGEYRGSLLRTSVFTLVVRAIVIQQQFLNDKLNIYFLVARNFDVQTILKSLN